MEKLIAKIKRREKKSKKRRNKGGAGAEDEEDDGGTMERKCVDFRYLNDQLSKETK